jgi:hypothetical protein
MQLYDLRNSEIYTKYAWIHYSTVHTYHRVWLDVRMPTPAPTSLNGKSMRERPLMMSDFMGGGGVMGV